jgi:copper transporter 1
MSDHSGHHGMMSASVDTPTPSPSTGHANHLVVGDGSSGMEHGMMMYFHFGLGDRVLFYDWVLSSISLTVMTCVVFFILAFLYEGLKCYREFLIKKRILLQRSFPISVRNVGSGSDHNRVIETEEEASNGVHGENGNLRPTTHRTGSSKIFNLPHVLQSLLHVVQVALSYTLMLGFMTFNAWICISILFGVGLGYFTFCWRKLSVVDVTEHCH